MHVCIYVYGALKMELKEARSEGVPLFIWLTGENIAPMQNF
jgi:hypothetical protein